MSNCLATLCYRKARQDELKVSTPFEKLKPATNSPHQRCARVHPLRQPQPQRQGKAEESSRDPPIPQRMDGGCAPKSKTVKLVLTKKQLKEMIKNRDLTGVSVQLADGFWDNGRSPRWRPSLPTIAE